MSARKLTLAQLRVLAMIRDDGNADGLYYECRGPNPRMAQVTADRVLGALEKRGFVTDNGCWTITDAGREALVTAERAWVSGIIALEDTRGGIVPSGANPRKKASGG